MAAYAADMGGAELEPSKRKPDVAYDPTVSVVVIQSSIEARCSALSRVARYFEEFQGRLG